jgi:outer membrane protein assembly factor BamB
MKPIRPTLFALTIALASASAALALSPDWPGWLGPHRDNKSTDTGLLKQWPAGGPKLLWKAPNLGHGFSTVSIANDTLYTTGDQDNGMLRLFAINIDGTPKWNVDIGAYPNLDHPGARSTPTLDADKVYLLTGEGNLTCRSTADGKELWHHMMSEYGGKQPGWGYAESPLIYNNTLIITPGGNTPIVALDKTSGEVVWKSQGVKAGAQYGSVVAFTYENMPLLAAGTQAGLICVRADNGQFQWKNDFAANNTANCPTPAYADGYLFWANGYGKGGVCVKLAAEGGKCTATEAWTTKDMVCHHGGYVIVDGYIYGNNEGSWSCLNLKDGTPAWDRQKAVGKGSLCYADGMLYLFGEKGGKAGLYTCSPTSLEQKGQVTVQGSGPSWAHPVVTGGRLYLRYDQTLYCFDVKAN